MNIEFKYELDSIDWVEAAEVIKLAPLGVREPEKLRRAFEKSFLVCFAIISKKIIGMGRAISDGEYNAAIYDLVVLPEFQSTGVGRKILTELHERLPVETIILYAVPGKEPFYEKLGYSKMQTAMAKKIQDAESFRLNGYIE